jgi:hypothetical protein
MLEHLPSKCKALNLKLVLPKKRKEKKKMKLITYIHKSIHESSQVKFCSKYF